MGRCQLRDGSALCSAGRSCSEPAEHNSGPGTGRQLACTCTGKGGTPAGLVTVSDSIRMAESWTYIDDTNQEE